MTCRSGWGAAVASVFGVILLLGLRLPLAWRTRARWLHRVVIDHRRFSFLDGLLELRHASLQVLLLAHENQVLYGKLCIGFAELLRVPSGFLGLLRPHNRVVFGILPATALFAQLFDAHEGAYKLLWLVVSVAHWYLSLVCTSVEGSHPPFPLLCELLHFGELPCREVLRVVRFRWVFQCCDGSHRGYHLLVRHGVGDVDRSARHHCAIVTCLLSRRAIG